MFNTRSSVFLNGGLYLNGKALIPFLPLYVLGMGIFFKNLIGNKVSYKILFIIFGLTVLWALCLETAFGYLYVLDGNYLLWRFDFI